PPHRRRAPLARRDGRGGRSRPGAAPARGEAGLPPARPERRSVRGAGGLAPRGRPEPLASMVPRIIHQIWVGPDPLPGELRGYVDSWKRQHPDWEHRLWTEDSLPRDLVRPESRERLRHPAERSDILRLELLWRL